MPSERSFTRLGGALISLVLIGDSVTPGFAFVPFSPSPTERFAPAQIEEVQWCRWGCGPGWGFWGPAAVAGGIVAGTIAGAAAVAAAPGYYAGPSPAYYYGPGPYYGPRPCLRRWIDPYGRPHWRRVC